MNSFFARQPVFDKKLNVVAYELPYHTDLGIGNAAALPAYDIWSQCEQPDADGMVDNFETIGLEKLTGGKPAYVRFDLPMLERDAYTQFPRESLWVQVGGHDPANRYLTACQSLKAGQYRLILDDFIYTPDRQAFLHLADLVQVDIRGVKAPATIAACRRSGVPLLAKHVHTLDDYQWALTNSFTYFQGDFFRRPVTLTERKIDPLRGNYVQLIALVNTPDIDFNRVANVIKRDVALSYKLLRLVNSAYFGLRNEIKNIQHALAILGVKEVRKWVSLLSIMSIGEEKTFELMRMSMVRARFMELFGERVRTGYSSEDLFLIGMFSLLDVILDRSMPDLLEQMSLSRAISEVLLEGQGEAAGILRAIIHYEACEWDSVLAICHRYGMDEDALSSFYIESLIWCGSLFA